MEPSDNLAASPRPTELPSQQAWSVCAVEVCLLVLLFVLFAGGPPPGINETHYLCKAKHYWDPSFCAPDFFLNSRDAHTVFYWTVGWIALLKVGGQAISLAAFAWIGRLIVWSLLAVAWQRLSSAVTTRFGMSVLSAGVFLVALRHGHMAGEWVVGGVEAKGFAYALVFFALAAMLRERWLLVFPLLGAAAAFHVIVGGWAVLAAALAWFVLRSQKQSSVPSLQALLPSLAVGFAFSLPGLVPCLILDRGASPDVVAQGNIAYVYARLSHHLVINRMPWHYLLRHAALIAAVFVAAWPQRHDRLVRTIVAFTLGAVLLEGVGIVMDQGLLYAPDALRARLLRYYWYRLGDAIVPMALALLLVRLSAGEGCRWKHSGCVVIAMAMVTGCGLLEMKFGDPASDIPAAEFRLRRSSDVLSYRQRHVDWVSCCEWVRTHTPKDAVLLTPRGQQSFKWFAQRAEVVSWKDCPQDAEGVVEWLKRYEDVYPSADGEKIMFGPTIDPSLPPEERWRRLANRYGADYLVLDLAEQSPLDLPLIYPARVEFNPSFAVYRLR